MVVHCKKDKFDVYIGRPSQWGNPFVIGKDGDRKMVVDKFELWLKDGMSFGNAGATELKRQAILKDLSLLKGKTLGCFCSPLSCHGDILSAMANN